MTRYKAIFDALMAEFDKTEVKFLDKGSKDGPKKRVYYVTARTVMNRLDEVVGPEGWHDTYTPSEHSVICRLSIRLPNGTLLTKEDAGGYAGMKDEGDDDKSGFSDAFKRAAVKFGVGRYLYGDGIPLLTDAGLATDAGEDEPDAGSANHGSREQPAPAPEAPAPPSEPARSESEGLSRDAQIALEEPSIPVDDGTFWDHLNETVTKANAQYKKMHPRSLPPVVLREAIKSVAYLTKKAGLTDIDLEQKRTGKQWEIELSVMAGDPATKAWMIEALNSHIKIAYEKADAEIRKPKAPARA